MLAAPAWLALLRGEGSDHAASFTPGAIAVNNVALPLAIALFFAGLIGGRSWLARLLGSTAGSGSGAATMSSTSPSPRSDPRLRRPELARQRRSASPPSS
ncbi:MAG: hypothetical protein R3F11_32945 [Verrucomicrobiales bacterium]